MRVWIDAHISPAIAKWLNENYGVEASSLRAVGLRDASDRKVVEEARKNGVGILMTKDAGLVRLVETSGQPPRVIWLTCGNTSNVRLRAILERHLPTALKLVGEGAAVVEISDSAE